MTAIFFSVSECTSYTESHISITNTSTFNETFMANRQRMKKSQRVISQSRKNRYIISQTFRDCRRVYIYATRTQQHQSEMAKRLPGVAKNPRPYMRIIKARQTILIKTSCVRPLSLSLSHCPLSRKRRTRGQMEKKKNPQARRRNFLFPLNPLATEFQSLSNGPKATGSSSSSSNLEFDTHVYVYGGKNAHHPGVYIAISPPPTRYTI